MMLTIHHAIPSVSNASAGHAKHAATNTNYAAFAGKVCVACGPYHCGLTTDTPTFTCPRHQHQFCSKSNKIQVPNIHKEDTIVNK